MNNLNSIGKISGALIIGATAGAILGILFAPEKGCKTRSNIMNGAKDLAKDIKNKMRDEANNLRKKAQDLEDMAKDKVEEIFDNGKHKTEETLLGK